MKLSALAIVILLNYATSFSLQRLLSPKGSRRGLPMSCRASLQGGDCVLVVGGTGGVGQLVSRKLQARGDIRVRIASRSKERGEAIVAAMDSVPVNPIEVVELDLVQGSDTQLREALQGVSGLVISVGTTAFPTLKWRDGNTPEAIDKMAVTRLANEAATLSSLKKIILITSVGVYRTDQMPFKVLNLFGVLDAKRSGEDAVKAAVSRAANTAAEYAIVRPGRLVGGPFTNLDVARLLQIEGGAENGVEVAVGDSLLGDCKRDACAEAVVQCLMNNFCRNLEFSIVSTEEMALNDNQWTKVFQRMRS